MKSGLVLGLLGLVVVLGLPEPGDTAVLRALLMQLIDGGLTSVAVYWFLAQDLGKALVDGVVALLARIKIRVEWGEVARYTAVALAGGLSLGFYALGMVLGFVPNPGSVAAWLNLGLTLLGVGFTGSQVLHARLKARM